MDDIFGRAIYEYQKGERDSPLIIYNRYGDPEEMPIEEYFRGEADFSRIDNYAVSLCKGKVLEIGAGAGAISLVLQEKGRDVHALEISEGCVLTMKERGVVSVIEQDLFSWETEHKFDTIIMLMNGIGITGILNNLDLMLSKLISLLAPGGQILFDSSDVAYLYHDEIPANKYYGEIEYKYSYNGSMGEWFSWLYVDFETLEARAKICGVQMQLIMEEETGQYLVRAFK